MNPERVTPPPTVAAPVYVPAMHGLRGLAALGVITFHVGGAALWIPNHEVPRAFYNSLGPMALDVLFFISGFVLFLPVVLNGTLGSVRSFAIRRLARMAPAYYVVTAVTLAAFPLLSNAAVERSSDRSVLSVLIHAVFLHGELLPRSTGFTVNAPVWSLSIDFVFYLLLPLVAVAYLRRPLIGLALALACSAAWRAAFIDPSAVRPYEGLDFMVQFPLFMGDFGAGMTAAWLFLRLRDRGWPERYGRRLVAVAVGAVVALVVLAYIGGASSPYYLSVFEEPLAVRTLIPVALLVLVVAISLAPRRAQWPLTNRPLVAFGEISYSVYLWHLPIIFFGFYTLDIGRHSGNLWLWGVFVLSTATAVGAVSYFLVELPARRLGRRLAARMRRREAARSAGLATEGAPTS